ncbi:hypothetical protein, variant [Blastomyces gilchristii SLH14081]|uniref:Uncharacterized protein n=2 Tax=Blastomyces TaxID=229219 RepID=A0A179UZS3_BLAGS|nr:hypothetical protein, variant [Blastomyces gilchristii SLH14081]KMW67969.1 hypothetical protein, variant [Blastomyces dermatitidis ATCC 18188]OAT13350.1 hypothetical protein, variant [Blastomyces gilchristii SLH14081]
MKCYIPSLPFLLARSEPCHLNSSIPSYKDNQPNTFHLPKLFPVLYCTRTRLHRQLTAIFCWITKPPSYVQVQYMHSSYVLPSTRSYSVTATTVLFLSFFSDRDGSGTCTVACQQLQAQGEMWR